MKYEKPQLTLLAPALKTIQSSYVKQRHITPDSLSILATMSAYEADE